jgi:uncharacterized protein with NAD-binding domain and iron-sulfur cluster
MAGLSTAWELSSGNWRDRLQSITVYQRGWRLGGKGASSRGRHGRIEEHGLHVLLGYYDATFRVLREAYDELDRPRTDPDCPIQDWRDAFVPTGKVGLADRHDGEWSPFVTAFSTNDRLPGEPGAEDEPLRPVDTAVRALRLLVDFHRSIAPESVGDRVYLSTSPSPRDRGSDLQALVRSAGFTALATILAAFERASRITSEQVLSTPAATALVSALEAWKDGIRSAVMVDASARRTWQLVDLVLTNLQGMAVDGLLSGGSFPKIDDLDYREWLRRHGAAPETVDSAIVRGMYDLTFAYEDGDRTRPRFSAGLGLQLATRMLFDFKGSIFWRMRAGMGEVVFAPLYEALVRRGVEFRFFHRLDRLEVGRDRGIAEVLLTRQAELASDGDGYQPLVRVQALPCWPDRPDPSQLDGDPGADLESHWSRAGVAKVALHQDEDYDVLVLAVSLGMVPHVAADLIDTNPQWAAMVREVATVATRSAQLWMAPSEAELGWEGPPGVTLSGFGNRFDTWASMTHLLPMETWPGESRPGSLAYFCGAMPDAPPDKAHEVVGGELERFLEEEIDDLWPGSHGPDGFEWGSVVDKYWRANLDPSDRYVQSLPGSGKHRMAPGGTGFHNLVVAGDWTACGLDAGCLEAATRSGILAGRAVLDRGRVEEREIVA